MRKYIMCDVLPARMIWHDAQKHFTGKGEKPDGQKHPIRNPRNYKIDERDTKQAPTQP